MSPATRNALGALGAGLAVGVTADLLLPVEPWGLNLFACVIALVAAGVWVSRRSGLVPSPDTGWLALTALLLGAAFLRRDAESHAQEDKERFELATLRNQADNMCYQLEKMMKEHADKLTDADKAPLTKAIETTKEKAKGTDAAAIKSAIEQLEAASHAFSKVLYEKGATAGAAGGPEGAAGPSPEAKKPDDDVIEGEFEVKK